MAYSLDQLKRKKVYIPPRVLFYGGNRLGKSTVGASAPNSIILPTEPTEADEIKALSAFPRLDSYTALLDAIEFLFTEDHPFETAVVDSADWADRLVTQHVCQQNGWANLESVKFNKDGYLQAVACWNEILVGLDALRKERSMMIILTAKETTRSVPDALGTHYTQFVPALSEGGQGMKADNPLKTVCDWCDVIGYIRHNIDIAQVKSATGTKDSKAVVQTGDCVRKLHLETHPSYLGGNRYGLSDMPFNNPFDWDFFINSIKQSI